MDSRRHFLQQLATLGAGISFLPVAGKAMTGQSGNELTGQPGSALFSEQPYQGPVLRVAVMGLGGYGTRVSKALQKCQKAKLVGVISGTPSKIEKWRAEYGIPEKNCYNYETYDQIKDNPDIDAVYVITPNALHHEAVLRVAAAGKHVICEKPMAISSQQAREMIAACKKANVKLLVGYRMHFEANTLEAIRMRREGELGQIQFFQGLTGFRIGDPNQWRLNKELAGGGSLMDIGIYALNGARYMTGLEPEWVTAQETKTDPEKFKDGVDETIQFQLGFPGGVVASCLSSYAMNHLNRFLLTGTKGFVELHPAMSYGPIKGQSNQGPLELPHANHQMVQLDEMAGIIFENKPNPVPADGEEALKDLLIIEAIYRAAKTGQRQKLPV